MSGIRFSEGGQRLRVRARVRVKGMVASLPNGALSTGGSPGRGDHMRVRVRVRGGYG